MSRPKPVAWLWLLAIRILGLSAFATACSGDSGPSQEEYDQLKAQLDSASKEADQFKQQAGDLQKENSDLATQVAGAPAPSDETVLLAAVVVTPAPPGPTATPLPPGAPTATPRPPAPDSYYQPVEFSGFVDVLATTRASSFNVASTISCTQSGTFKRGQRIVFRVEIIDVANGVRLNDKNTESLTLVMENGDTATARWSQRAGGRVPGAPWMWSAVWDIPLDYKLGGVDFHFEIKMLDGRTGTWTPPFLVSDSSDTRPKVFE